MMRRASLRVRRHCTAASELFRSLGDAMGKSMHDAFFTLASRARTLAAFYQDQGAALP